jgi:homoserine/homoserine lactone efflux protein
MSLNFILLYSMTVLIASIIPGPSMLLALSHGMQYGAKKTIASALGNVTITIIQASISIAGLGTILVASATLFHLIRWAGAAYLIYIGISILCSSNELVSNINWGQNDKINSSKKMYLQAALVTAGNPKAIIFFTAIFPQFIDPNSAYLFQSCLLLGICTFIAFCCFMIYAMSGQKVVSLFSRANVGKYLKPIVGSTFVGVGIGLAASNK